LQWDTRALDPNKGSTQREASEECGNSKELKAEYEKVKFELDM